MMITTYEFVRILAGSQSAGVALSDSLISEARRAGWLEEWDELHAGEPILRKNAARILHMFMLKILHEPDESGDGPARKLRDIYDCRVCAGHVAQVYDKGIMDAFFFEDVNDGKTPQMREEFGVFELNLNMDRDEAIDSINRLFDKKLRRKRKLTD